MRILLVVVILAVGCVRGGERPERKHRPTRRAHAGDRLPPLDQQGTPVPGGVLRVALGAEPPSLNYQLDPLDAWGKRLNDLLYESMARPNPKTWKHEPRLAERWEIADDFLSFVFHLRRDVRWHDGHRFTADDVVFTFDKIRDPRSKTMAIRSFLDPVSKITKVDDYTVKFELSRVYWYAFDAIAELYIYPKHIYSNGDFNTHPNNRKPIGTGRYKFVHWKTGDEIVLQRNADSYRAKGTYLDRIVFKIITDASVRVQMVRRGDLDIAPRLSPELWKKITQEQELSDRFWRLRHIPAGLQWIGWNQARPMFADRRVRRALTMLLDRDDIVQNLRLGLDAPAVSWFYPGSKEHNPEVSSWPYDPEAAMELLTEAGWKDRDGDGIRDKEGKPFEFTFMYTAGRVFYAQLASLMATEFKKAGLKVRTSQLEWAVYVERLRRHEFDACSLLWQLYPRSDPYQIWHSKEADGGSNFISFNHPAADKLLVDARLEFDDKKRTAMYHRFSEILHEEEPYTMLFNRYNLSLVSKRLGGLYSTPYGLLRFDEMFVRREAM